MSEGNGVLPDCWEHVSLGDVTAVSKAKCEPSNADVQYYVGLEHIEGGSNRLLGTGSTADVKSTKSVFQRGDVLYGKLRPYLKKVCRPDFDGICSTDILVFPKSPAIDNGFLLHFLSRQETADFATQNSNGINLPRISAKALSELEILLPPLNEQRRIVAKIEALQERSRKAREALAEVGPLLEQFRQSLLAAAFRGDLTADWRAENPDVEPASELLARIRIERRQKWEQAELAKYEAKGKKPPKNWQDKYNEPEPVDETELPELPEGWGYTKIDLLLEQSRPGLKTGPFGSLLKKHEHRESGVPVLGIENIGEMQFVPGSKIHITEEKAEQLSDYNVHTNDLLISRSGTVGEVCTVPDQLGPARFSTNIIRVVLAQDGMLPNFLGYLFNGSTFVKRQISKACAGSTRDFLNKTILESLVFPLPPLVEQELICNTIYNVMDSVANSRSILSQLSSDLDQLDQSILAKAFRGELVPQDPQEEPAGVLLERIRQQREAAAQNGKPNRKTKRASRKKKA